jgi:hypothetical protein
LNVDGLLGAEPALDAVCEKGLLLMGGAPKANDDVVAGAAGVCPNENAPDDDGAREISPGF